MYLDIRPPTPARARRDPPRGASANTGSGRGAARRHFSSRAADLIHLGTVCPWPWTSDGRRTGRASGRGRVEPPGGIIEAMSVEGGYGSSELGVRAGVLVVGAGPTGLALAAQLHAVGTTVRIVDRQLDRVHESRALVVLPRTLEVLRGLGVSAKLVERGNDAVQLQMHFGRKLVRTRLFDIGLEDTAYPFLLFISQSETEAVLTEHLTARGVHVERGVELVALAAEEQQVACTLRHHDGTTERLRVGYLLAATAPTAASVASPGSG